MKSMVSGRLAVFVSLLLAASVLPARAQVEMCASDDVNFKLGILGQFQADTLENPTLDENTNNLFIRRVRLMFGGQVAKNVTFFVETDAPNLGRSVPPSAKNFQPGAIIQDAYAEFKVNDGFAIDAGLMFVPYAATQSSTGRGAGFRRAEFTVQLQLFYF